jgi:anaerobic magnesium-protoporphyrin IX monomethyl ester cyclase
MTHTILLASSLFLRDDRKQLERMKPYAPLGTLLVASACRAQGHEVVVFDATFADGVEDFVTMMNNVRPDVVGVLEDNFNYLTKMCTVGTRDAMLRMIGSARAAGCRVAVNGSDAADRPSMYLEAGAHAVLTGEPDRSFPALAAAWRTSATADITEIPGLIVSDTDAGVRSTSHNRGLEDLDELPLPAWDLVDVERYRREWTDAHGRFSWNMVTSRGCPFGCNWCAKPIFGRRYSQRSPECVAEEMRLLKEQVRPDHIWFADDIFGLTTQWITHFSAEVAERNARTPFMIQCRADLLRPEVARALAAAGAEEVWIGVESGSQRILDAMDKGTTVSEVRAATSALKEHGIRACWFIQLGYPSETWDDVISTRDLVHHERPDDIGVSVAYPLPGTRFHAKVQAQLGLRQNWQDSDDLAMLFQGSYTTDFYRRLRDALHDDVRSGSPDVMRWEALESEERLHRSAAPLVSAS